MDQFRIQFCSIFLFSALVQPVPVDADTDIAVHGTAVLHSQCFRIPLFKDQLLFLCVFRFCLQHIRKKRSGSGTRPGTVLRLRVVIPAGHRSTVFQQRNADMLHADLRGVFFRSPQRRTHAADPGKGQQADRRNSSHRRYNGIAEHHKEFFHLSFLLPT